VSGEGFDPYDVPKIKINGNSLPETVQLLDIRVDLGLNVVSSTTLHFAGSITDVGATIAKLGAEVEIRSPKGGLVFKGEVTGVEVDRSGDGDHITTLTALDALHQLSGHSQVVARTKTTISDVLKKLAQAAGLSTEIAATTVTYDYLFQTGTDLDYIAELAERAGLDWWSHGGKLYAKPTTVGTPALTLKATDLFRLSVRASGKRPQKVTVSGWDSKTSRTIEGSATLSDDVLGATAKLANQVKSFKPTLAQEHRTSAIPLVIPGEAAKVAGAALNRAASGALRAEMEGHAMWAAKPGDTVEVEDGGDLDGKYVVSAIEHRVADGSSSTRLIAGSRHPEGLMGGGGGGTLHGRTPGIVMAKVTNIDDPENLGRVKVKFLGLDESQESEWARVLSMAAGPNTGATMLPEVNDEVLVTFEDNDVRRPIVLGSVYSSKTALPKLERQGGKFTHVTLMERFGHQILMWGTGSEQGITIKLKNAGEITIDHEGTRLVGVSGKKTTITQGQAKIEMTDQGDITIDGNKVTINAKSQLAFESKGQAALKGATVAVEGQGTVDVKAPKTSVKGDGMLELKGGLVQIN
jgi:phage protein D/phage baseplate assembly protein gpV